MYACMHGLHACARRARIFVSTLCADTMNMYMCIDREEERQGPDTGVKTPESEEHLLLLSSEERQSQKKTRGDEVCPSGESKRAHRMEICT